MKAPSIRQSRNSKSDIFKKYNSRNYKSRRIIHSTTSYWRRDKPVFALGAVERRIESL